MKYINVKERLFKVCKEKKMNLTDLAKKTGISRSTMYSWDTSMPSRDSLMKICQALNIPISYFFDEEQELIDKKQIIRELKELIKKIEQM